MKKTAVLIFTLLLAICCFTCAAYAQEPTSMQSAKVEDGDFTIVAVHSVSPLTTGTNKAEALEDLMFWIDDNSESYNVKYVSFTGNLTAGSNTSSINREIAFEQAANDEKQHSEAKLLAKALKILSDAEISYGFSCSAYDNINRGFFRENILTEYLSLDSMIQYEMELQEYTSENFAISFTVNGMQYMIVQLELWPRTATRDWFDTLMKGNENARVIVCTSSFLDANGEMYTMWDWQPDDRYVPDRAKNYSTELKGYNLGNLDKPLDGDKLWRDCFARYDNIMAIVCGSNGTNGSISPKILTNDNGYSVAAIPTSSSDSYGNQYETIATFITFSPDGTIKSLDTAPYMGIIEDSEKATSLKLKEAKPVDAGDELPKIIQQYNGANTGYILGYEGNLFKPDANMTRAEACTIFSRLILGTNTIPSGYTTRFTDLKESDWFYNAVAFLDQSGFFKRLTSTAYSPNAPITRAEFVDLANSASTLVKKNNSLVFEDIPADHFYYDSIMAAASAGLVNGYEDNTFRPDKTITRAEVVTVINRLLGLVVSDKTVDASKAENTFKDTLGHWARANIIMASNSNVHGAYYDKATLDGVVESNDSYTITTDTYKLVINKKSGKVTSFINLYTGESILSNNKNPHFIYLLSKNNSKIAPTSLSTEGSRIKVTFKNGAVVYLIVDAQKKYVAFEIDSQVPENLAKGVIFANVITSITPSWENEDGYRIGLWSMHYAVEPEFAANEGGSSVSASAYSIIGNGTMGAKAAIVFDKQANYLEALRTVSDATDRSVGLASAEGGPYGILAESNHSDYIMQNVNVESDADYLISEARKYGIEQFDMHKGASNFTQGDFRFYGTQTGTAKEFYDKIGKRLEDAGIELGLHTYAYYVDYNATDILTNPKWQQQLEFMPDEYTLKKDITSSRKNLPTLEDASGFDTTVSFFYKNSRYVLVDEEIIKVGSGTSAGFVSIERGQCGTVAAEHKEGAKIRHLSGYFNCFVSQIGSELFYHVADLTAKAFNDGGFDFIYIDAIDGIDEHLAEEQAEFDWYYMNSFISRIVSQLNKDAQIEFSSSTKQFYQVRGRMGALDTINRGINYYVDAHAKSGYENTLKGSTSTLGWFSFYNGETSGLYNTIGKALFKDDIDNIGYQAVLNNLTMVYNPSPFGSEQSNPMLHYNASYYNKYYSEIRKSGYFNKDTLEKVKANGNEFRIIEKNAGEYAFLEMYYNKGNVGNLAESKLTVSGNNPFSSQMPYIRIEKRYSTLLEDGILLADFDESKTLGEQTLTRSVRVDMTEHMVMSFKVKGTGKDGDAMLITLQSGLVSGESGGIINYLVELSFDGWREVVLVDSDNGDFDYGKYSFKSTGWTYNHIRTIPSYADIRTVTIEVCGNGKNAMISDIMIYKQTEAPLKNPTLTVGSSSVTFNTTLKGGEYVEYDPVTDKAQVFHADQTISDITYSGALTIPTGNYTCTLSGEAETSAQTRARIVIGFCGSEITN